MLLQRMGRMGFECCCSAWGAWGLNVAALPKQQCNLRCGLPTLTPTCCHSRFLMLHPHSPVHSSSIPVLTLLFTHPRSQSSRTLLPVSTAAPP
eukprot:114883-Chlamydomonas_euryale.AAC.3